MNNDNLPEPIRDLIRSQKLHAEMQEATRRLADNGSNQIENEVLVDLWRDLGDQTETYWEAMVAVGAFVTAHDAVRKAFAPLTPLVSARCLEALAKVLIAQATLTREVQAKQEEAAASFKKQP